MINLVLPKTDIIGVKFLGFDGRKNMTLDIPWKDIPDEKELRDQKQYLYKKMPGLEVQKGDIVVVSCATGFQVAVVTEVDVITSKNMDWAYAISRVDLKAYRAEIARQKQVEQLRKAIEAKRAQMEKAAVYELLASKDPTFAEMLEQFKNIGGTFD